MSAAKAGATDECTDKKCAADRIYDTARDLFYHRGVRAVGVDEIVTQAGVTKPSLYRAFASKDDLVAACLEGDAEQSKCDLEAYLAEAPQEPRAQLSALVRFFAAKTERPDFRGCPMSNTAVEFPEPAHPGRAVAEACKTELLELVALKARALPIRDPQGLADGIMLIIEGAMASHHIFGSQGPSCAMMASAEALIDGHLSRGAP